jgi:cytoskeletal protein RodZ
VKLLNEAQQKQLQEITSRLREVREEKSIRIEEIAAQTRIRQFFLQALEEGRFEDLPEPVFVQGFIRRYGDIIGLDGIALADAFATHVFSLDSALNGNNFSRKANLYIPLVVPYILLLTAASYGLFHLLNLEPNPGHSVKSLAESEISPVVKAPSTVPTPAATAILSPKAPTTSANVEVKP